MINNVSAPSNHSNLHSSIYHILIYLNSWLTHVTLVNIWDLSHVPGSNLFVLERTLSAPLDNINEIKLDAICILWKWITCNKQHGNERSQIQYILASTYISCPMYIYWKYETKVPKYLDLFRCEKFQYSSDFISFFISVVLSFASLKSLKSCLKSWLLWI